MLDKTDMSNPQIIEFSFSFIDSIFVSLLLGDTF